MVKQSSLGGIEMAKNKENNEKKRMTSKNKKAGEGNPKLTGPNRPST